MTNADKVRQMTDDELLKCFLHFCGCNFRFKVRCFEYRSCSDCLKAWMGKRRTKTKPRRKKRK